MYLQFLGLFVPFVLASDFDTIASRLRQSAGVASLSHSYSATAGASIKNVSSWFGSQTADGSWSDINYASGCNSPPGTFAAEAHWVRITGLGQAWSGLNPNAPANYSQSPAVFAAASKALDWWIEHDYNNTACLQYGGTPTCPCGTPGLWNTNWWHQVIGVPTLASQACILLYTGNLTDTQKAKCLDYGIQGSNFSTTQPSLGKYQTAANLVDIMLDVINAAVYSSNTSLLTQAYDVADSVFLYANDTGADGIHPDGSFLQHSGQLYNGDYGVAFLDAFISLQLGAAGTQWQSNPSVQNSMATFIRGNDWQLFTDKNDGKLYWDLSVVGRFIAFPRSDHFATAGIGFNVSALDEIVNSWTGSSDVSAEMNRELQTQNAVTLSGNKAYWASDYMVHRRSSYTLFNKMISTRTRNSEYTNGANPLGYHLNQGLLWTWVDGTEYQDIVGAWNWYLVPGTTVLYHYPTLNSSWIAVNGKRDFVGSVSDGRIGVSVMDYIDPHDGSISYKRAWFFFEDEVVNIIGNATRLSTSTNAPIVTVLDQRLASGNMTINGSESSSVQNTTATTLLYNTTGYYTHGTPFLLNAAVSEETGNWPAISTSTAGSVTKQIFTAYSTLESGATFAYSMLPAIDSATLAQRSTAPIFSIVNSTQVLGVAGNNTLALTFWPGSSNTISVPCAAPGFASSGEFTMTISDPSIILIQKTDSRLWLHASDPTQLLTQLQVDIQSSGIAVNCGNMTSCTATDSGASVTFSLPMGAYAGQTVAGILGV